MRLRPRPSFRIDRRILPLPDGGQICLEIVENNSAAPHGPFVLIAPTLGGSSRDSCVANLAAACAGRGWRVAFVNVRGGAGVKFTTTRLTFSNDYDHIEAAVRFVREQFAPGFLFLAGFSLGSVQSMRYNSCGEGRLDGCAITSHLHDYWRCGRAIAKPVARWVFNPSLVRALTHQLLKNPHIPPEDKDVSRIISPPSFDEVIGYKYREGPRSTQEAFELGSIYDKIPVARAPTIVIASHDDPVTLEEFLPIKEARGSDSVALIHTQEGGHVGFLTGLRARESIVDEIVPEFFDALMRDERAKNTKRE
jgi:predicted alpha/beta-fold hydrolase